MSHTIGQVEQDNQQSNSNSSHANQGSLKSEDSKLKSTTCLSDADYEFLFNQLLEGIAHGWHERRIARFFKQLGDRGKQADWVVWLNRFHAKVSSLPVQSKHQLGTIMIRLGEITQSSTQINQIGAASYRIGRELLFGNTQALIWEYVGPDLASEPSRLNLETEPELLIKLPNDLASLDSPTVEETEPKLFSEPLAPLNETNTNSIEEVALDSTLLENLNNQAKYQAEPDAEVFLPDGSSNSTDLNKIANHSNLI